MKPAFILALLTLAGCALEPRPVDGIYLDAVQIAVGDTATVWLHTTLDEIHGFQVTLIANDAIAQPVDVVQGAALRRVDLFSVNLGGPFVTVAGASALPLTVGGRLVGVRYVGRRPGKTSVSVREFNVNEQPRPVRVEGSVEVR